MLYENLTILLMSRSFHGLRVAFKCLNRSLHWIYSLGYLPRSHTAFPESLFRTCSLFWHVLACLSTSYLKYTILIWGQGLRAQDLPSSFEWNHSPYVDKHTRDLLYPLYYDLFHVSYICFGSRTASRMYHRYAYFFLVFLSFSYVCTPCHPEEILSYLLVARARSKVPVGRG